MAKANRLLPTVLQCDTISTASCVAIFKLSLGPIFIVLHC